MPTDRTMTVKLLFNGYYLAAGDPRLNGPNGTTSPPGYYGSATYSFVSGSEGLTSSAITSDGTINLPGVTVGSTWSENCDITFFLDPASCANPAGAPPNMQGGSQNGAMLTVTWASEISNDLTKTAMICGTKVVAADGSYTITPNANMLTRWVDGAKTQLLLDDDDPSGNTYYYRLAIIIPSVSNYYISLDPGITIRPSTKPPLV